MICSKTELACLVDYGDVLLTSLDKRVALRQLERAHDEDIPLVVL